MSGKELLVFTCIFFQLGSMLALLVTALTADDRFDLVLMELIIAGLATICIGIISRTAPPG